MSYKEWLDNEYEQWIRALEGSTVHDFKENEVVKRMLGEIEWPTAFLPMITSYERELITVIDNIGKAVPGEISGVGWRMTYYACQVLLREPASIIEIGGGVGEYYAITRALGYRGDYWIADLSEVQRFQRKYLKEVSSRTGLHTELQIPDRFDMCVSFYALGELDDERKDWYTKNVIKHCPRGFIIWNPHSGASTEIPFECEVKDEYPLLSEGNKQLEW